jgi:hypothetical protein
VQALKLKQPNNLKSCRGSTRYNSVEFELKFITYAFFNPEKENATFLFYFAWATPQVDSRKKWKRELES